jgi:hypothetical protein
LQGTLAACATGSFDVRSAARTTAVNRWGEAHVISIQGIALQTPQPMVGLASGTGISRGATMKSTVLNMGRPLKCSTDGHRLRSPGGHCLTHLCDLQDDNVFIEEPLAFPKNMDY